jgi:2-keto-3-deoxy-L-fuconate dehydrogenase
VLVTSADAYMGPAIVERFRAAGATVIADTGTYVDPADPARVVAEAGEIDVLVVNLVAMPMPQAGTDIADDQWNLAFDRMVHPTMRFVRAALPQMIVRRAGKIVVITSAAPLRPTAGRSAYTAARGAQNAFVTAVGAEAAQHNVQVNAIAQNFVYGGYRPDALDDPQFRSRVEREVPAQRLAEGWEQADLALFLASPGSDFIGGQVIPFAGGWVT